MHRCFTPDHTTQYLANIPSGSSSNSPKKTHPNIHNAALHSKLRKHVPNLQVAKSTFFYSASFRASCFLPTSFVLLLPRSCSFVSCLPHLHLAVMKLMLGVTHHHKHPAPVEIWLSKHTNSSSAHPALPLSVCRLPIIPLLLTVFLDLCFASSKICRCSVSSLQCHHQDLHANSTGRGEEVQ